MFESPHIDELLPEKQQLQFEEVHFLESLQLLSDLDYLPADAWSGKKIRVSRNLIGAIQQFRRELGQFYLEEPQSFALLMEDLQEEFPPPGTETELSPEELHVLKELSSLEGDFDFFSLPVEGEYGLVSRVICYRLWRYGQCRREEFHPFDDEMRENLLRLGKWLRKKDPLEIAKLLGNLDLLVRELLKRRTYPGSKFANVVIYRTTGNPLGSNRALLRKAGDRFLAQLRETVSAAQYQTFEKNIIEKVVRPLLDQNRDFQYLQTLQNDQVNRFFLRVAQVRLWVDGFYEGRLDWDFGEVSTKAIRKFLRVRFEEDNRRVNRELDKVLVRVHDEYYAMNIRFFLQILQEDTEESAIVARRPVRASLGSRISMAHRHLPEMTELKSRFSPTPIPLPSGDPITNIFNNVMEFPITKTAGEEPKESIRESRSGPPPDPREALSKTMENQLRTYPKKLQEQMEKGRRGYHGWRNVGKWLHWLMQKAGGALQGLKTFFKNIGNGLRHLFDKLKQGFVQLSRALGFVFGKRRLVTGSGADKVETRFDFDFDGETVLRQGFSGESLAAHRDKLDEYADVLVSSLELTGKLIKWSTQIASGPIGWVRIGLAVVREVEVVLAARKLRQGYSTLRV